MGLRRTDTSLHVMSKRWFLSVAALPQVVAFNPCGSSVPSTQVFESRLSLQDTGGVVEKGRKSALKRKNNKIESSSTDKDCNLFDGNPPRSKRRAFSPSSNNRLIFHNLTENDFALPLKKTAGSKKILQSHFNKTLNSIVSEVYKNKNPLLAAFALILSSEGFSDDYSELYAQLVDFSDGGRDNNSSPMDILTKGSEVLLSCMTNWAYTIINNSGPTSYDLFDHLTFLYPRSRATKLMIDSLVCNNLLRAQTCGFNYPYEIDEERQRWVFDA